VLYIFCNQISVIKLIPMIIDDDGGGGGGDNDDGLKTKTAEVWQKNRSTEE